MVEETAARKAMRAMLSGKIDDSVVAFSESTKKIDNKLGNTQVVTSKKQFKTIINEDFEQENSEPDYMSDIKKKLLNDRANGKTETFIDGHQSKSTIEITPDVISMLMKGKLNEAKEINIPKQQLVEEVRLQPIHNSNPIEQYKSPKNKNSFEDIDREILIEELLKSPDLKSLLLEIVLDNVVSNGRLQKMVKSILKEELKPALLQTLKEIKAGK